MDRGSPRERDSLPPGASCTFQRDRPPVVRILWNVAACARRRTGALRVRAPLPQLRRFRL